MHTRARKPGRARRAVGAVLLTSGLLFAAACVASAKWWVGYCAQGWLADFGDGTLYTRRIRQDSWERPLHGWHGGVNGQYNGRTWEWTWWVFGEGKVSGEPIAAHSIWPIAPILTVIGGAMFLKGRRTAIRAARNQCLSCGYSRIGIADEARCPECGQAGEATTPAAR